MDFVFAPPKTTKAATTPLVLPHFWVPRWDTRSKVDKLWDHIETIRKTKGPITANNTLRDICRQDIFFLAREILRYRDMAEPLHDDLCDFMVDAEDRRKDSLVLIPRAHFKSTLCTVARSIWWMINDPDVAIGLFSGDMKNARKFALEIRNHLENNEELVKAFPDVFWKRPAKESPQWTQDEFVIRRTKDGMSRKEGTLKIFGLLQGIPTGDHFSPGRLVGDDVVDQDICSSENQMAKVESQLEYLVPLQQLPDDPIHLVGTRYHMRDVYGKILKNRDYAVYFRRAVEDKKLIFPSRFTHETLDKARIKIGNYKYYCQYEMNPQDPGDKKFELSWLRSYKRWPITKHYDPYYTRFLMVDPANKQKKESDFTAAMVFAVDHKFNVLVLDGIHDKLNPKQRIDMVYYLVEKWRLDKVGYETIAFQETDKFWIEQEMLTRGSYFQIIEISHRKQNKFDYIMSSQPLYEGGKFFLPSEPMTFTRTWVNPDDGFAKTLDFKEMFLKQYDLYPNVAHDDLLDVVAMAQNIMDAGRIPKPKEPPPQDGPYPKKKEDEFNLLAH